jgi:hypothetical protein
MNRLEAWAKHYEDPMKEIASAMRSARTAERHVVDRARDYRSAVARGNKAEIDAAAAALRSAWEQDIRLKGGKPEDFIPNYPHYDVSPVYHVGPFGEIKTSKLWILGLIAAIGLGFYFWKIRN